MAFLSKRAAVSWTRREPWFLLFTLVFGFSYILVASLTAAADIRLVLPVLWLEHVVLGIGLWAGYVFLGGLMQAGTRRDAAPAFPDPNAGQHLR